MQIIKNPKKETWAQILARPTLDTKFLERTTAKILEDVRQHGDEALKFCARHFDKVELDDFLVSEEEFAAALPEVMQQALAAKDVDRRAAMLDDFSAQCVQKVVTALRELLGGFSADDGIRLS